MNYLDLALACAQSYTDNDVGVIECVTSEYGKMIVKQIENKIVMAWSGTDNFNDIVADVDAELFPVGGGLVHKGFFKWAINTGYFAAKNYVGKNAVYTGHSAGGAVAAIMGLINNTHAVTFAQPMCVDDKFAAHFDTTNIERFITSSDVVPKTKIKGLNHLPLTYEAVDNIESFSLSSLEIAHSINHYIDMMHDFLSNKTL